MLPPILVWADQRNWVSRGLIKQKPPQYETIEERYPAVVGSNGSVDGRDGQGGYDGHNGNVGNVGNGRPAPPQPQPQSQPQPVSPGVHVPPTPAPADLWLPQFRNP